jgi:hypothetical protein
MDHSNRRHGAWAKPSQLSSDMGTLKQRNTSIRHVRGLKRRSSRGKRDSKLFGRESGSPSLHDRQPVKSPIDSTGANDALRLDFVLAGSVVGGYRNHASNLNWAAFGLLNTNTIAVAYLVDPKLRLIAGQDFDDLGPQRSWSALHEHLGRKLKVPASYRERRHSVPLQEPQ